MFMFNNNKITQAVFLISGILMMVFFVAINIIYFYPYHIINVKCPIEIVNKVVHPGSSLYYKIEYFKYYDIPEVISQQLIINNHIITLYEHSHNTTMDKKFNNITLQLKMPKNIELGQAKVKVLLQYKILWGLRVINVLRETETFRIVND